MLQLVAECSGPRKMKFRCINSDQTNKIGAGTSAAERDTKNYCLSFVVKLCNCTVIFRLPQQLVVLLPSPPTMSQYRDPYTEQQQGGHNLQHGDPSYNQYDIRQPHQPYDQGGFDPYTTGEYRDDPNANPQATPYAPAAQEVNPHGHSGFAKEIGQ